MQSPKPKLVSIVGTRPQFIKALPLSRALRGNDRFEHITIHTGQHFDSNMSEIFFRELDIKRPRFQLNINGGSHGAMTGRMLGATEQILLEQKPAGVIVYGDTNSTLAGALAAAKLDIPVIHIEAGMRSFNSKMPEEINRIVTDRLSTIFLCSTSHAVANLRQEGSVENVHHVGDLMYDSALLAEPIALRHSNIIERIDLEPKHYALATVHRAENTDDPGALAQIASYLIRASETLPIVLPLHPRTREALAKLAIHFPEKSVRLIEPVGYLDMYRLMQHAEVVFTDSGGVQKEAYFHRVPCVTLRSETEWGETVECGWNRLWTETDYHPRRDIYEYGDGDAAGKIVAILEKGET